MINKATLQKAFLNTVKISLLL